MPGSNIPIYVVGLNFKTAPIDVREKVQSQIDTAGLFLRLQGQKDFEGVVFLKTCNRIEIYGHGNHQDANGAFDAYGVDASMVYEKQGKDAINHLVTVSSSLDSMVIGEPQILGQVKQAYEYAKKHHYMSAVLDQVFQNTFRVAKKVRNETSIGDYAVSLSSIAVDLSNEFFEDLSNKQVLIVGAGQMAELAAKHFQKRKIEKLWIMNRSYDHGVDLAKKTNGIPLQLSMLEEKIKDIDILLVSTGANQHLLTRDQIKPHLAQRKHRPLLCIDISVPRNLDPDIHKFEDVYLYGIDDLQNVVDQHIQIRESEAEEARVLVRKEVDRFTHNLTMPSLSDTIQKIHQKIAPLCEEEVRRLLDALELSFEEVELVKKSFTHLAEKLLLNPIMYIQNTDVSQDRDQRLRLVRDVFLVEKDESQ